MIIFIVGNIAAGKTTLIEVIKKKLCSNIVHISLDDYRRKYNKSNTIAGEEKAHLKMIKDIKKAKFVILESSGTGKWYPLYLDYHDDVITIKLGTTDKDCMSRQDNRVSEGYKMPPFPYNLTVKDGIRWIGDKVKRMEADLVLNGSCSVKENAMKALVYIGKRTGE